MTYDHNSIEKKWQKRWEEDKTFKTENSTEKPKKYILDMFPYPSGAGLHVGHPKGYTATDIVSRYYHATGHNVLHTMGFDAFGLPAENYAIKTGTHPAITTAENIGVFTQQLQALGFSYDWDRVVDTTDPEYYRWTQWIFLELFKRGLAYEQDLPINYCPSCKTGLANEEVTSTNTCDRCGTRVERRAIRQWVLRITEYADRLLSDLDTLDWPEGIKEMQRNWIGRSEGCEFSMMRKVENKPVALILHGWGETNTVTDWHWIPDLKIKLEQSGYQVFIPELPNPGKPNLSEQLKFLEQYRDQMDENSIVIGHSMGGFLGTHFVAGLDKKINKLIGVGPIFNGLIDHVDWSTWYGWNEGSESMRIEYEAARVKQNTKEWKVFLSENDECIIYPEAKKYFDLLGVTHIDIPGAGHFCEGDGYATFPALLESLDHISVYTTRVDTVYGMTYAILAPDHPQVQDFITESEKVTCEQYIERAKGQSDLDRTNEGKEKTGVWTGSYVVNPFNGESVPLWIADYVLGSYGTGAVMAVPAHDERDFEFAKKYDLAIRQSISKKYGKESPDSIRRDRVGAIIMRNNTVLCERLNTKDTKFNGEYLLIGGGIEEGESPVEALSREIIEELNISDFEILEQVGIYSSQWFSIPKQENRSMMHHIFYIKLDDTKISENTDEAELEWVAIDRLLSDLDQNNKQDQSDAIREVMNQGTFTDDGFLIQSGEFSGLTSAEARRIFSEKAESEGFGHKKVNYKLRDWLFSRQRYWGEPIPLIHISHEDFDVLPRITDMSEATDASIAYIYDKKGTEKRCKNCTCDEGCTKLIIGGKTFSRVYDGITGKLVIDSRLPITLPQVERYEPAGDGQSPLATVPDWVNVELAQNLNGKRETNTMPQWGGSCWYYLRYMDPHNSEALASTESLNYWQNVDEYVGGAEHAVLHLLYARFWHKVLYDIGVVPTIEPFHKLTNVGLILGPDGNKMSKSKGNVINPNDIVAEYGADTLRLYEMSMSAFTDAAPWNPDAIIGVRRFLDKAYSTIVEGKNKAKDDMKAMKLLHKTVKKVGEDIVAYKFNTAISALQILLNEGIPTDAEFALEWSDKFITILHPFAPHIAEELWSTCHPEVSEAQDLPDRSHIEEPRDDEKNKSIYYASWPEYDEWMLVDDEVTIAIQINGKLRGTYTGLNGVMQDEVSTYAQETPDIAKWLEGKVFVKEIFIPNKMLSIVMKDV